MNHIVNTFVRSLREKCTLRAKGKIIGILVKFHRKVLFDWPDVSENISAPEVLLQKAEVTIAEKSFWDVIC